MKVKSLLKSLAWRYLVGLLVVLTGLFGCAVPRERGLEPVARVDVREIGRQVRIMTFNAEWLVATADESSKNPWKPEYVLNEHVERIAGVIETLEPDIVNLVEVTSTAAVERLMTILREKGLTTYIFFHIESHDTGTGQDIALITKFAPDLVDGAPIRTFFSRRTGKWRVEYSWTTAGGVTHTDTTSISKNVVYCVTIGSQKIGFLGLHLKAFPNDRKSNAQRTGQAKVAQKIIREEIVDRGYLPIVLGDLNDYDPDVPDRDESSATMTAVLRLLKDYDPVSPGDELLNTASRISRQFDRYTAYWDKNKNGALDERDPMTMIDHILVHRDLMPHVQRVFIDHGHGAATTDHWPVIVDIVLE